MSHYVAKKALMRILGSALVLCSLNVALDWGLFGEFGKRVLILVCVVTFFSIRYLRPTEHDRASHLRREESGGAE